MIVQRIVSRSHDNRCQVLTFSFGIVFLTFGLLVSIFWQHVYDSVVLKILPLSNGSESQTFHMWSKSDFPFYFKIYMFNWTNAEATATVGEKPRLQQVGPYAYRLDVYRKNFHWNSNDTITYLTGQQLHFEPRFSEGNPYTDIITSPNVILITVADRLSSSSGISTQLFIKLVLKWYHIPPYVMKSVSELLFDGYDDKLLGLLKKNRVNSLPDRFAWHRQKNNSVNIFNIYTGQKDLSKMGTVHSHNYTTRLPFEGACGYVRGSPGDFWPPDTTKKENVSLFIPDFCGSFEFQKKGEEMVNDISGIRFEGEESTFDDGTRHPQKTCYCPDGRCSWKYGIRDISPCVNAPVFLSFPHFYGADPSYLNMVHGLKPEKELHSFHLTFQKDYGFILKGAARFQFNLPLKPVLHLNSLKNVSDMLIPALWIEQKIDLPQSVMNELRFSFRTVPLTLSIVGFIFLILGSVILLLGVVLLVIRTQYTHQSIPPSDTTNETETSPLINYK